MSTVRFERKGDMVGYVYIAPTKLGVAHKLTSAEWVAAISKVELLIGGQVIDEQTSTFSQYMAPTVLAQNLTKSTSGFAVATESKFYPLRFSFCENAQTAIPLIALQYHDVPRDLSMTQPTRVMISTPSTTTSSVLKMVWVV
jgi:hypothetical protein